MTKQEKKVQTFKQFKHDFHNMIKKNFSEFDNYLSINEHLNNYQKFI